MEESMHGCQQRVDDVEADRTDVVVCGDQGTNMRRREMGEDRAEREQREDGEAQAECQTTPLLFASDIRLEKAAIRVPSSMPVVSQRRPIRG